MDKDQKKSELRLMATMLYAQGYKLECIITAEKIYDAVDEYMERKEEKENDLASD